MSMHDIKSSYFIIILFSHLSEEAKLKIVKYNKNYQCLMNQTYLNGKRKGKEKEYDKYGTGVILFEGNYLNGKRHGEGELYFKTKDLKFKGEYLNGKKWNGKIYARKGYMAYELKNGNGFVKEYDDYYGDLLFEGEYKNGEKNGKGILSDEYGIEFDGEFLNGKRWNGRGIEYEDREFKFEGEYINGRKIPLREILDDD